jgi:hypothetical protein
MSTRWDPDVEKQKRVGYDLTCKNCGQGYNQHNPWPGLPCPVKPTITKERIVKMAESLASLTYRELISKTNIDRTTALTCAKDAADAFGNALLRDLPTNGVEVQDPLKKPYTPPTLTGPVDSKK